MIKPLTGCFFCFFLHYLQNTYSVFCIYTAKNELLDLLNFITLIHDLIKSDNGKLNVCNQVCVY